MMFSPTINLPGMDPTGNTPLFLNFFSELAVFHNVTAPHMAVSGRIDPPGRTDPPGRLTPPAAATHRGRGLSPPCTAASQAAGVGSRGFP